MTYGRYKKSQGKVLRVIRKKNQVVVQGVNMKYKVVDDEEMQRRKKTIQKEYPIHVSNVSLIDPNLNEPCRTKTGYLEDGTKVRVSKKSGGIIPKPDRSEMTYDNRTKTRETGIYDTKPEDVHEKTYKGEDLLKVQLEFQEYINMKKLKERELIFNDTFDA